MNQIILPTPAPLEQLQLPASLCGQHGDNRAPKATQKQIDANNDLHAIQTWLQEFDHSPQTQRTYRKEAERLLLWCILQKEKALSSLNRDDLRDYQQFLVDPQPLAQWCGPRRPRHDPRWRPFEKALTPNSIAQAITIINALLNYLVEAGYLAGNPLGLMRRQRTRKQPKQTTTTERFFEQDLWLLIIKYIQQLPRNTPRQQREHARLDFLFHFLYLLGPRISELANHNMQSIKKIQGKWWWEVTGKGQTTQQIPVNDQLLKAIIRYRQFYHLTPLPRTHDEQPLIMNLMGTKRISVNMIHRIVKATFDGCANWIVEDHPEYAAKLRKASTHWIRHTAITHQADSGIDLRYIQRNARHASIETTMHYQHAETHRWHDSMSQHTMPEQSTTLEEES